MTKTKLPQYKYKMMPQSIFVYLYHALIRYFFLYSCMIYCCIENINAQTPRKNRPYFSYLYSENDAYPRMITDRYFTNGSTLGIGAPDSLLSPSINRFLKRFFFNIEKNNTHTSLFFNMAMFTPSRFYDSLPISDRPYAGWTSLGLSHISKHKTRAIGLISTYSLGVLGKYSGQSWIQKNWHDAAKKTFVKGWESQIANDIALNINFLGEKRLYQPTKYIDLLGFSELNIGTVSNYLGFGTVLRLGWFEDYFSAPTFANSTTHQRQMFTILKPQVRFVAQNSLLQGGIFNRSSPYTLSANALERVYFQFEIGYGLSVGRYHFSFTQSFRTPEFRGAFNMQWGNASGIFNF